MAKSLKKNFKSLLLSFLLFPCLTGLLFAAEIESKADLFFENGTVYTVDQKDTIAEALAVKDGRIIFVGSLKDGQQYKGDKTKIVDLAEGILLPGFFDTHIHTPGPLIPQMFDFNLIGISDLNDVEKIITDFVKKHPDQDMYYGIGYLTYIFSGPEEKKGPTKARLDALCPDKPMVIYSYDAHTAWLNSKAFEKFGIDKNTAAPKGGVIEKDEKTGELWGTIKDSATGLIPELKANPEKVITALKAYQEMMNGFGVTSILSISAFETLFPIPWEGLRALEKDNRLTLRVRGSVSMNESHDLDEQLKTILETRKKYHSDLLRMNTVKFFADGVVDARTAYLLTPYNDNPNNRGEFYWGQDLLKEAFVKVNQAGLQAHVHSIGDGSTKAVLDAFEQAKTATPAGDYRNTITHLQLVDPKDIKRFKPLNIIASIQPYWHSKEPEFWESVEAVALGERALQEYPLKSFLDAGVLLTSSSDSPVTFIPDPLMGIEKGVTRNLVGEKYYNLPEITDMDNPEYLLAPEQRVSVKDMIRSFTINSAFTTFLEKETGSLEVGKAADMIVIDKNLLEIPPLEISNAKVLRTYLNGKLVYEASHVQSGN